MTIAKSMLTKAKKAGISLTEGDNGYVAHHPVHDATFRAANPGQAMKNMVAYIDIVTNYRSYKARILDDGTLEVHSTDGEFEVVGAMPEVALNEVRDHYQRSRSDLTIEDEESDPESTEDEDEQEPHSVVKPRYRDIYREQGRNGVGSGDWLDLTLSRLCLTSKGIDIDRFEDVCNANGVDLSKYNRTTNGWQGRLRMTGRNLLAKVVKAQGELLIPVSMAEDGQTSLKVNSEWTPNKKYAKAADLEQEAVEAANSATPAAAE